MIRFGLRSYCFIKQQQFVVGHSPTPFRLAKSQTLTPLLSYLCFHSSNNNNNDNNNDNNNNNNNQHQHHRHRHHQRKKKSPILSEVEDLKLYTPEALEFHLRIRNAHHETLQQLLKLNGKQFEKAELESLIRQSAHKADKIDIFNHASDLWNHNLFFRCLENGPRPPPTPFIEFIQFTFGSFKGLEERFLEQCVGAFGNAWVWLVSVNHRLEVVTTSNSESLLLLGEHYITPLLNIDLWEHAYLPQYELDIKDYVRTWFKTVNWEVVAEIWQARPIPLTPTPTLTTPTLTTPTSTPTPTSATPTPTPTSTSTSTTPTSTTPTPTSTSTAPKREWWKEFLN